MLPDMLISLLMLEPPEMDQMTTISAANGVSTRHQAFAEHATNASLSLEDGKGENGEGLAGDVLHPDDLPGARTRP